MMKKMGVLAVALFAGLAVVGCSSHETAQAPEVAQNPEQPETVQVTTMPVEAGAEVGVAAEVTAPAVAAPAESEAPAVEAQPQP